MPEEPRSGSGAPGSKEAEAGRLRQMAAETILSTTNLTDELTDEEARPLVRWGVMQAEAAAHDLALASQNHEDAPGTDLDDLLADRLGPVRRLMKGINRLVPGRHGLPTEALNEELQRLMALAEGLPRPPLLETPVVPLAELSARQADMDGHAFVQALVGLLEGSGWGVELGRPHQHGIGEQGDKGEAGEFRQARDYVDDGAGDCPPDPGGVSVPGRGDPGS